MLKACASIEDKDENSIQFVIHTTSFSRNIGAKRLIQMWRQLRPDFASTNRSASTYANIFENEILVIFVV